MITDWLTPALRLLPAEPAHAVALWALRRGLVAAAGEPADPSLSVSVLGMVLPSPVGLAAGFDKNGEAIDGLFDLGFGFVEIGSVTPRPQPGNPRPRLFRLAADRAVINRMGFNNDGVAAVAKRVASWRDLGRRPGGVLGVNLGKNKTTKDVGADYSIGAARIARLADYVVVNVSSRKKPGLRDLQMSDSLEELLARTRRSLASAAASPRGVGWERSGAPPPLFLKIAPDLGERTELVLAELALGGAADGLIVSNTTLARADSLTSKARGETGGLSGRPLFAPSTALLRRIHILTHGRVPLIGVGGVESGRDAYEKIRCGASLVQLYSALVYQGPGLIRRINTDLAALARADGFASIAQAVGVDAR